MKIVELTKNEISDLLFEHICKGDTGDGIPNIRSDNDTFILEEKRQSPVSKKMLKAWKDNMDSMTEPEKINYVRNKKLIDLNETPEYITTQVIKQYEESPIKDRRKINQYIIENGLNLLYKYVRQF